MLWILHKGIGQSCTSRHWGGGSLGKVFVLQAQRLEFDPQKPHEKPGAVGHTCISSAGHVETGESLGLADQLASLA